MQSSTIRLTVVSAKVQKNTIESGRPHTDIARSAVGVSAYNRSKRTIHDQQGCSPDGVGWGLE